MNLLPLVYRSRDSYSSVKPEGQNDDARLDEWDLRTRGGGEGFLGKYEPSR